MAFGLHLRTPLLGALTLCLALPACGDESNQDEGEVGSETGDGDGDGPADTTVGETGDGDGDAGDGDGDGDGDGVVLMLVAVIMVIMMTITTSVTDQGREGAHFVLQRKVQIEFHGVQDSSHLRQRLQPSTGTMRRPDLLCIVPECFGISDGQHVQINTQRVPHLDVVPASHQVMAVLAVRGAFEQTVSDCWGRVRSQEIQDGQVEHHHGEMRRRESVFTFGPAHVYTQIYETLDSL
mgnify:CR=1 FL=1